MINVMTFGLCQGSGLKDTGSSVAPILFQGEVKL